MQRLLSEGLFVASYKFALVHALADLAVLKGDDSGSPLELSTKDIAAKFVELYWRQSRPFPVGGQSSGLILQQNTGKQAAIIAKIAESQQEFGGSLFRLKQGSPDHWRGSSCRSRYSCPNNASLEAPNGWQWSHWSSCTTMWAKEPKSTLKPGVSYCLRPSTKLIRDLIEGAWVSIRSEVERQQARQHHRPWIVFIWQRKSLP